MASYAAMLALPVIVGLSLWMRQPAGHVADYGNGLIEHGSRRATLVLNDGKILSLDTSRMTLKETGGVTIRTDSRALVYADSSVSREVGLQNRLITPKGGEYTIILADGTKVWVNAATEIQLPREVYRKGTAGVFGRGGLFRGGKGYCLPVYRGNGGMEVKVYGTQFNVNTRQGNLIRTTLVEGTVAVKPEGLPEVMLKPNQQAVFNKLVGQVVVRDVDVLSYVAWQKGNYYFENKSISEILNELSLWYDIEVFFRSDEVRDERFSGYLPRYGEIEKLLLLIEKTSHVRFEVKGKAIVVYK